MNAAPSNKQAGPGRRSSLTEAERREAARIRNHTYQTSPEYKARRKERYRRDAKYRKACLERAQAFSEKATEPDRLTYAAYVRHQLTHLNSKGEQLHCSREGGRAKQIHALTLPQACYFFGRSPVVVRGWINSGKFPEPPYRSAANVRMYSAQQVANLANALVAHLRTQTAHLTSTRTDAIKALFKAVK